LKKLGQKHKSAREKRKWKKTKHHEKNKRGDSWRVKKGGVQGEPAKNGLRQKKNLEKGGTGKRGGGGGRRPKTRYPGRENVCNSNSVKRSKSKSLTLSG